MQLWFLIMWILVICESNAIHGNLLSLSLSFFLWIYMVINAFLISFKTSLESSFQHLWRALHRGRCSDSMNYLPAVFQQGIRNICADWYVGNFSTFLPSGRLSLLSLLCASLLLYHIYFSSSAVSNAWTCKCSPHMVFFFLRVFQFIYLSKKWKRYRSSKLTSDMFIAVALARVWKLNKCRITTAKHGSGWHPAADKVCNLKYLK